MKKAVFLVVLSLLVISIPLFAEETAQKKEFDLDKKKEEISARIDKRIGVLQELKKCIADAKTKEEFKKCGETFKEERRGIWEGMRRAR